MAKLLLVEDDNNLREIYEARLSAEGYDITTAQNGEEALSVAKNVHPDLIISDVMMPRISGFEMLDILRNTDELKNTKIIMLTALGQAEDRGRADNLGADRYLVKSQVTLEDIVKAAEELLSDGAAPSTQDATVAPAITPAPEAPSATEEITPPEPVIPVATSEPAAIIPTETIEPVTTTTPDATPETIIESAAVVQPEPVPLTATPLPTTTPQDTVSPAPQIVTPVTVQPEPVVQPMTTTVTVPDPDPLTAAPVTSSTTQTPPAQPLDTSAVASPAVTGNSQTLAAEEAAIEQQIASFAEASEPTSQQTQPAIAPSEAADIPTPTSSANDAVLAQAMSDLTATPSTQPEPVAVMDEPVPAPTPTPEPTPTPSPAPQPDMTAETAGAPQQVSGHKTIQPLDGSTNASTPDLQTLLAAEDAKEASVAPAPQDVATAPTEPTKPAIDPNTIAL